MRSFATVWLGRRAQQELTSLLQQQQISQSYLKGCASLQSGSTVWSYDVR